MTAKKQKFYVTTPIYYVNDKPHIGHAYTTIAADVLARYNKLLGKEVFFLTGTDEHGAKIEKSAKEAKVDIQKFCDRNSARFKQAWEPLNIKYDKFIRTTEKEHEKVVTAVLRKLKTAKTPLGNDAIFEGEYEGLYCTGCEAFLTEADLVDGLCPAHKKKPEIVKEKNWFFKLSDYEEFLKNKISKGELAVFPKARENEVLSLIKGGLRDIAISRPNVKWGIPVPFDKNQTIYVWIDALLNYISALGYPSGKDFKKFWPADIQLMAKDILKFHTVIWPALLEAIEVELPKKVFAHGFFTIEGEKMSKSLGNAIDPVELSEKYSADVVRYFLLSEFAFGEDGDFSIKRLEERYTSDLANGLGNLVSRTSNLLEKNDISLTLKKNSDKQLVKAFQKEMEICGFNEALGLLWNKLRESDEFLSIKAPWKMENKDEIKKVLEVVSQNIYDVALLLKPFMPETAKKIAHQFSQRNIKKGEILFPRLEK